MNILECQIIFYLEFKRFCIRKLLKFIQCAQNKYAIFSYLFKALSDISPNKRVIWNFICSYSELHRIFSNLLVIAAAILSNYRCSNNYPHCQIDFFDITPESGKPLVVDYSFIPINKPLFNGIKHFYAKKIHDLCSVFLWIIGEIRFNTSG